MSVRLVTISLIVCLAVCIHTAASQEYCAINHWASGIHPHPYDCDKYVTCSNNATTVVHCPPGKLFDPKLNACRDASAVTDRCNDAVTTTPSSTVSPADDFCLKNNWATGIHPHPFNCDRFIQCNSFVTSISFCPQGQQFDSYYQTCSQHAPPCNDATITPTYTTLVSQCVNDTRGDILFILDSSSSIGYDNYQKQLSFAANITNDFPVSPRNVQFSVLVFSVVAESVFPFDRYYRKDELRSAIMSTPYVGSTTNTYLALDYARTTSFSAAHGTRTGVPHIAVVMTDGLSSNFQETQQAAQRLKDSGVVVIAIGIGLFNRTELDVIASNPNLVKQVGSYEVLQELHTDVSVTICNNVLNNTCSSLKLADIILVLDSSASILSNNFREQLRFAANLTQNFAIGPNDVRFAAVTFGTTVNKLFDLDSYTSHDAIYRAITNASYQGSGTNTAMALRYITDNNMFGAAHGGRDGATKIIITLTDGVSDNPANTRQQATYLKERGYHMMSIGIGGFLNTTELVALSTDVRNIFIADSFDVLHRLQQEVFVQTCQIPSQTNAGDLWNVCLEQNWRNGIHAHPFDCTKFIECTYLHTFVMHCPNNLVYDPLKETCMYKNDAISCFDYNDYNPFPNYTTSIPPTVPTNIDVTNICSNNHWADGTHPHPYDCSVYLTCHSGVTTKLACPTGTVYDPVVNSCRNPAVAQPCNDAHHISTQPIIVGPSTNITAMMSICYDYNLPDGIYPDPGSCTHYVECSNGNTYHMACPDGLEFNTRLSTCDDVHNVNCNDNYSYVFTVHVG